MQEHIDRAQLRAWMKRAAERFGSAKAWAEEANTSPSNVTRFIKKPDAPLPTMRTLTKLAACVPDLPPPFAAGLVPPRRPDRPFIPEVDVRAGMGGGGVRSEEFNVTDEYGNTISADAIAARWWLPDDYLARELKVSAKTAWIIEVQGDSMAPTLQSGDRVMIDTAQRKPSPPGIFALWDGLAIVAKRLDYIPGSEPATVEIISDNTLHKRYERTVEEAHIIGRVVWFARKL